MVLYEVLLSVVLRKDGWGDLADGLRVMEVVVSRRIGEKCHRGSITLMCTSGHPGAHHLIFLSITF